jgi:hypothetical protein
MHLRYNKFLLFACVLFSSLAVISCKKSDKGGLKPLESGKYVFDKVGDNSSLRMYTKNGEVKDQDLIEHYKNKYSSQFIPTGTTSLDSFHIIDENNARYINNSGRARDFVVTKMDDHYEFRSKDTSNYFSQQADQFLINLGKYKPYSISLPTPMGYMTTTLQYFYASAGQNTLVFPFLNVVRFATIRNGQYYNTYSYSYKINNVFDEKLPGTLTTDTVLVQTFNATYKIL